MGFLDNYLNEMSSGTYKGGGSGGVTAPTAPTAPTSTGASPYSYSGHDMATQGFGPNGPDSITQYNQPADDKSWGSRLGAQGGLGGRGQGGNYNQAPAHQSAQMMSGYMGDTGAAQGLDQGKFLSKGYKDVSQFGSLGTLLGYLKAMPGGQIDYQGTTPDRLSYLSQFQQGQY